MRKAVLIILLAVSVTTFIGFGCTNDEKGGGVKSFLSNAFKKGGSGVPVTVEKPILVERSVAITVPGILTPSDRVEVKLPNDARIESFFVNVGETVAKGAPLFQVSRQDQNLKLAQLRAEQKELQANLEKTSYFLRNRDRLLEEGRITTEQYDALETEMERIEEDIERVRTQLSGLEGATTEPAVHDSPIAGVVQSKLTSAGGVSIANTPIVTIVRNNPMIVNFRLASYEAKTVRKGMPVQVRLVDMRTEKFKATVSAVGTELDRDTNTFEVKAELPNPQGMLKAGMNAFVEFTGPEKQKFFEIPSNALIVDRRRYYVFTVVQGTAHKIRVIPREIRGDIAEIVEGLHTNDMVVVKGNEKLSEGTVVDIW